MSSVSRAALSARNVSSGSTTHGSSARIRPSRPAASIISSRARPRFASGPTTATRTRSSGPGAASTLPASPRSWTKAGGRMPGALGRPHEPPDQAAGERRGRLAVHPVHELLGDDQPVARRPR